MLNELLNQYINELSDTTNYRPSIHNEKKYRLLANNFNNKGHLISPREDINYNNYSQNQVKKFLKLFKPERIYNVRNKSNSENVRKSGFIYPGNMNTNTQRFSTFGRTHRQVYFLGVDMATWPKGPQKLKFEHAICILELLILERARFWPVLAD